MGAISNLILAFLIAACALHIQLINFIQNQQGMQEKQHQVNVQQNLYLSSLVQNQQEMLEKQHQLTAQQNSYLRNLVQNLQEMQEKQHQLAAQQNSQFSSVVQNQQDVQEKQYQQLVNIASVLESIQMVSVPDCTTAPTSRQYMISPRNKALGSFTVYCDMDTTPGGWIVFQRRFNSSVDFDRNWVEYEDGFGSLAGEFWLGLKKLHVLTSHNKWELRVDLEDFEGNHAYALYDNFKVGDSSSLYRLTLGSYSGTAGDCMIDYDHMSLNGMAFTTKDKDNDKELHSNCGADYHSGWWHRSGTYANLNGLYLGQDGDNLTGMYWYEWKETQSLKISEMKIMPIG